MTATPAIDRADLVTVIANCAGVPEASMERVSVDVDRLSDDDLAFVADAAKRGFVQFRGGALVVPFGATL